MEWQSMKDETFFVDKSSDLEDLCIISSRPSHSSFLEELDDAYMRGRDVIVAVNPRDTFHSLMFDSHVSAILGAHKNIGICKNLKLGRIQFVDWNPDWMLSQWVCNKVLSWKTFRVQFRGIQNPCISSCLQVSFTSGHSKTCLDSYEAGINFRTSSKAWQASTMTDSNTLSRASSPNKSNESLCFP